MRCSEFERTWNERLDARAAVNPDLDRALEQHAASCRACSEIAARYRVLEQVLGACAISPAPPVGFVDRFLESQDLAPIPASWAFRFRRVLMPVAAAASLLLVVLLGGRDRLRLHPAGTSRPTAPLVESIDPRLLTEALTYAGSATWDLAWQTSAPAARIGRDVLDPASLVDNTAGTLPLPVTVAPSDDVLQAVGDRVNAGVRPFSGAARHAFGFLLVSPSSNATPSPRPTSSKGA